MGAIKLSILTHRKYDRFYFDANVTEPLVLKRRELRSELEYDLDIFPEKTAMEYLKQVSGCFGRSIYLITVSQDISPISKLRTKKGLLWKEKELRKLSNRKWEIGFPDGKSRLLSLINLDEFNYKTSESVVLNWIFSLILLSKTDMNTLSMHVEKWVAKDEHSVLSYDYTAVAKSLVSLRSTVVLRYFPADNGRHEALVVVGNKKFIDKNIGNCINSI